MNDLTLHSDLRQPTIDQHIRTLHFRFHAKLQSDRQKAPEKELDENSPFLKQERTKNKKEEECYFPISCLNFFDGLALESII